MSSVSLTGAGQFLGTPDYSAPEQIQGWAVDGRADQYALACVAYQLLTGVVPFERDQGMAVLLAHLSEPPPSLGSRRPDCPVPRIRCWPGGWRRPRRSGMDPAGISRTRCGRRSDWRPTSRSAPPPRPITREPRSPRRNHTSPDRTVAGTGKAAVPAEAGGTRNRRLGARRRASCRGRACGGSHRYRPRRSRHPCRDRAAGGHGCGARRYSRNCRNGHGGQPVGWNGNGEPGQARYPGNRTSRRQRQTGRPDDRRPHRRPARVVRSGLRRRGTVGPAPATPHRQPPRHQDRLDSAPSPPRDSAGGRGPCRGGSCSLRASHLPESPKFPERFPEFPKLPKFPE